MDNKIKVSKNRENILKEGLGEFIDKGYLNASVRSIARKCGISHTAIKGNHFKTKEDLFIAIVDEVSLVEVDAEEFPVEFALLLEKKISEKGLVKVLLEQPEKLYEIMKILGVE